MKINEIALKELSLDILTIDECNSTIGGGWYEMVDSAFHAAGQVVGGAAALMVRAVQYGLSHPKGINEGMENVH